MIDETEKHLSLQERRLLNIQRNQSFLSTLLAAEKALEGNSGGIGPTNATGDEDGSTITSLRGSNTITGEDDLDEHIVRFKCKDDLLAAFPFRSQQVQLLYRYLGRFDRIHYDHVPRPPLMLHGASATGKSSLLQSILFSEELLHVHIDCAAFHTLKQLFTSLQYEISVLLQTKLSAKRKRVSSKQLSIQQFYGLPCSSYLEFNTFIANIFSTSITNEINFIVVFENLHTVLDYQDEDALTTLLSLQEVCQANISLVYILQSTTIFHRADFRTAMLMQRCIQIHFTSYNETQARQILAKNFQQRLEHIDRLQDDTNDEEKDVGLEADKKLIKHEMSEQFASVIEHSLPQIYVFSHNLRDIFCIMLSIWHVWYKESACHMYESLIDKRKNSFVQTLRSTRTSPASSRLVSPVSSTSLQKPPITMIRGILELLLQRNILNVSVQDLTSIRKSLNLDETNAATAKGDQRKKVAAKDSFTVNTNMIPHRLKYLIVACFLASHNPKGSDNLTFIGEKSKKRKAQESTGANAKESLEASMTNTQGASQSNKAQSSNRYFSLERLLSIYAQVLRLSVQEAEDACYGSASLQALIMTLVNRKLMSLSPHWKASKPLYGSNISRSLADEIARSIHFPLNDFLVQHYKLAI